MTTSQPRPGYSPSCARSSRSFPLQVCVNTARHELQAVQKMLARFFFVGYSSRPAHAILSFSRKSKKS